MATPPRRIVPGQALHLTIQAVNRQYRFVPHKDVVDSIRFIFWHCVAKYEMAVHEMLWMSNHAHICMTDVHGVLPKFMCQMNSLISRQLNALRGVSGTNFEKGYSSIVLADDASIVGFCAYTLANPCAADLVSTASAWKGISTLKREYGECFEVVRPKCGLWREEEGTEKRRRKPSKLPSVVVAKLTRPNIMPKLSNEKLREAIRKETLTKERAAANKRRSKGSGRKRTKVKPVLGWAGVLKLPWNQCPRTRKPLFQRKPLVAARSTDLLLAEIEEIMKFRQHYEVELDIYIYGGSQYAIFPEHTWKMRTVYNAMCAA